MLARTGLITRQRALTPLLRQRNVSSSHSDHHDHHHVEEDATVYPKEGFTSPAWRKFFLASILAGAAYQFAPEASEDAFITHWISMYTTSSERWYDLNAGHAALSKDSAETVRVVTSASRPAVHRFRFPQMMDNASPFNVAVGMSADTSNVAFKTETQ